MSETKRFPTAVRERLRTLERAKGSHRCLNEILDKASAFFVQTALDRGAKRWGR